jgi:hypothetical protein
LFTQDVPVLQKPTARMLGWIERQWIERQAANRAMTPAEVYSIRFSPLLQREGVTQKPTSLINQWLRHNCLKIFLSRISALIHFRFLGSIWRRRYERHCFRVA